MTYDEQIAYLTKNPARIENYWCAGIGLFKIINTTPKFIGNAGCLTTIRAYPGVNKAYVNGIVDEQLTQEIADDDRIPKRSEDIKIEHLTIFKEWQERIDKLQTNG